MNNAGHWSEAESVVQEGLLVDADHYDLLIVLAAIKANLKNVDEAIELLESCIKLDPENSKASELLNQLKGDLDKS
jgi:tetratricopeptide (TPR) repeat protein